MKAELSLVTDPSLRQQPLGLSEGLAFRDCGILLCQLSDITGSGEEKQEQRELVSEHMCRSETEGRDRPRVGGSLLFYLITKRLDSGTSF